MSFLPPRVECSVCGVVADMVCDRKHAFSPWETPSGWGQTRTGEPLNICPRYACRGAAERYSDDLDRWGRLRRVAHADWCEQTHQLSERLEAAWLSENPEPVLGKMESVSVVGDVCT